MRKQLKNYTLLFLFILMSVCLTLTSTWVSKEISFPSIVSKALTLLIYIPFAAAIIWKFAVDVKNWKAKKKISAFNGIYYGFGLYYVLISVYRLLTSMEVKENFYYTVVVMGSVALYFLISFGHFSVSRDSLKANMIGISIYLVIYRLWYEFIGSYFFDFQPINSNLLTGSLGLLLPLVIMVLCQKDGKKKAWIPYITATLSSLIVFATGARALFLLVVVSVLVMLCFQIKNKQNLIRIGTSLFASVLVITSLALFNYGDVRYALYRETGITVPSIVSQSQTNPNKSEKPKRPNAQKQAQEQAQRSDNMRQELVNLGLDEIKENPVFGTGNVLFLYEVNDEYSTQQSSHNFLIESMICYGAVGTVLLAVLYIVLIVTTGFFEKRGKAVRFSKIGIVLLVMYYFALGFVQPTVFDPMISPLFALAAASFSKEMKKDEALPETGEAR